MAFLMIAFTTWLIRRQVRYEQAVLRAIAEDREDVARALERWAKKTVRDIEQAMRDGAR